MGIIYKAGVNIIISLSFCEIIKNKEYTMKITFGKRVNFSGSLKQYFSSSKLSEMASIFDFLIIVQYLKDIRAMYKPSNAPAYK